MEGWFILSIKQSVNFTRHPQDYLDAFKKEIRENSYPQKLEKKFVMQLLALDLILQDQAPCPVNKAGVPLALLPGI